MKRIPISVGLLLLFAVNVYALFPTPGPFKNNNNGATVTVCASDASANWRCNFKADGADDDVTIQAAHDSCPSTGCLIQLTDGTFDMTGQIDISKNNIIMQGVGWGTKLNATSGYASVNVRGIEVTGDYVTLKDFYVDGNDIMWHQIVATLVTHYSVF